MARDAAHGQRGPRWSGPNPLVDGLGYVPTFISPVTILPLRVSGDSPGSELVGQLLASPQWASVTTIGRREAEVPAAYTDWSPSKLRQVVVNMDALESEAAEAMAGVDTVFCALGTTRGAAGSAEAFAKVDRDYVAAAARAARAGGVPHFSLLTSQGANANVWAPSWKIFHGLLYSKVKGQVSGWGRGGGLCWVREEIGVSEGERARAWIIRHAPWHVACGLLCALLGRGLT